jgi:hypothetical protein
MYEPVPPMPTILTRSPRKPCIDGSDSPVGRSGVAVLERRTIIDQSYGSKHASTPVASNFTRCRFYLRTKTSISLMAVSRSAAPPCWSAE